MPYCRRLLQTEIFPQNASRRRSTFSCLQIVRVRLNEDRHVERRELEGVRHALLVTEVRKQTSTPSMRSRCRLKEVRAALGVLPGLDGAELRRLTRRASRLDFERCAQRQQVAGELR